MRAPVTEAVDGGGLARELVDGALERHDLAVADPVAEQVGGEAGVAELRHMGTGVGQPEQHVVAGQQPGDALGVVVGEDRPETGLEVVGQRDVEHDVERRAVPARLGQLDHASSDELGARW